MQCNGHYSAICIAGHALFCAAIRSSGFNCLICRILKNFSPAWTCASVIRMRVNNARPSINSKLIYDGADSWFVISRLQLRHYCYNNPLLIHVASRIVLRNSRLHSVYVNILTRLSHDNGQLIKHSTSTERNRKGQSFLCSYVDKNLSAEKNTLSETRNMQ